jgi:hypothetical protein
MMMLLGAGWAAIVGKVNIHDDPHHTFRILGGKGAL